MPMPSGFMPASTSLAAYSRLTSSGALTAREEAVLEVINGFGPTGCIFDQVQAALPHLPNSVSGRFLSLERKGWIVRTGVTRPGKTGNQQKVMWHREWAAAPPPITTGKKEKRPGFLAGMMFAAKIVIAESDLPTVKAKLREELMKVSKRSRLSA